MMTNNEAERNLAEAKDIPFYSYASTVRRLYQLGNSETKSEILNRLEVIVQKFDNQPLASQFNPSKARAIRMERGLSVKELASIAKVDRSYITKWERGSRVPYPRNRGNDVQINKGTIGYLLWLKQEGYNPFNLESSQNKSINELMPQ